MTITRYPWVKEKQHLSNPWVNRIAQMPKLSPRFNSGATL